MKFVSVILKFSNLINAAGTFFVPRHNIVIFNHNSSSSDQEKLANDWKAVGNDMRKAIVKYNVSLSK